MLVDAHCHLDFDELAAYRARAGICHGAGHPGSMASDKAREVSLETLIERTPDAYVVPSIGKDNWQRVSNLAAANDNIHAAYGIHPWWAHEHGEADIKALASWLERDDCVALGEVGLDATIELSSEEQQALLKPQLQLAADLGKPVMLHSVKTHEDMLRLLKAIGLRRGMVHAFSGSFEQGEQFIRQGLMLGISGIITYDRARKTRDAVARLPIDSLLLESDAPSMPVCGHQGEVNTPERLMDTAKSLAELRGCEVEEIVEQTARNSVRLFGPFPA
ncbi:TatD family hydrolase [Allohahella marinimesophila]|uniref:TatD family hydrolase n=1 Tax=Allohahella marinimesophila TaxID=1054972 RepID=A0ABP7NGJ3_9GAMM